MENNVTIRVYNDYDKKIWFTSQTSFKIKYEISGMTRIVEYDISNARGNMHHVTTASNENTINHLQRYENEDVVRIFRELPVIRNNWPRDTTKPFPATYPFYFYVGAGETETDEPATAFYRFPPPETNAEWVKRVGARITNLARCYADGVPGHHTRFDGLDTRVASSDETGQMLIGFLNWQLTQLGGGHTTQEDSVFATKEELEDFVTKVEARFPDKEAVSTFYYRHAHNQWAATSTRGQIFIPDDNHGHGEKIHDTYSVHVPPNTPRQGAQDDPNPVLEAAAEKSERDIRRIKAMFVNAAISPNDEVITQLEVEAEAYTPDFRNANLASLTVGTDDGALTLNRPAGSTPTTGFSSDITQYLVTLPTGKTAVGIVATPEHSEATVTGTGDQTGITTTRTVNIVVTSEDTRATKTYEITISPL